MKNVGVRAAIAAVRLWTSFYTWGLPDADREARRDEIDSDLWESVHDREAGRRGLALHIMARLVAGVPDDLGWRIEHGLATGMWRWPIAVSMFAAAILALWLVAEQTTSAELPELPASVRIGPYGRSLLDAPPPPPPPPPPPCPPPGFAQPSGTCTK